MLRRFVYRVYAIVAIAASTAAVTLAQLNLPRDFWQSKPQLLYLSVLVLSIAALGQLARYARPAKAIRQYEQNVRAIIVAGLAQVHASTGAPPDQIGIHFFRIGGLVRRRLVNVGALRLQPNPHMVDPVWTRGKGVVGKSWELNDTLAVDWGKFFTDWDARGKSQFQALSKSARYSLSWGEFQLTRGYSTIVASPIRRSSDGAAVGCVVLDLPSPISAASNLATKQALHDMAVSAAALGRPPLGWTDGRVQ